LGEETNFLDKNKTMKEMIFTIIKSI